MVATHLANVAQIHQFPVVDCGVPEMPTDGMIKFNGTVKGSIVHYKCNEGCIVGVVQRVCKSNGQWSGDVPYCKCKQTIIANYDRNTVIIVAS